jgi:hypothetical protein
MQHLEQAVGRKNGWQTQRTHQFAARWIGCTPASPEAGEIHQQVTQDNRSDQSLAEHECRERESDGDRVQDWRGGFGHASADHQVH